MSQTLYGLIDSLVSVCCPSSYKRFLYCYGQYCLHVSALTYVTTNRMPVVYLDVLGQLFAGMIFSSRIL